jgi:hypothetical protein
VGVVGGPQAAGNDVALPRHGTPCIRDFLVDAVPVPVTAGHNGNSVAGPPEDVAAVLGLPRSTVFGWIAQ